MKALEEIKARTEAATPGPWMKDPDEPVHIMKPDKPGFSWDGTVVATLQRDDLGLFEEANADFIAHARTDVPKLIAALEAVEGGLAGLDEIFSGDSEDDQAIRVITSGLRAATTEALA